MKKISKVVSSWDNANTWLKRIVAVISAVGVIYGAIMGIMAGAASWITAQLDTHLDSKLESLVSQVESLRAESEKTDRTLELSTTRLELSMLIAHNPNNVLEIEKVARYYFVDLGGDWYMSQIYSEWAKEYGGDLTFVVHKQ